MREHLALAIHISDIAAAAEVSEGCDFEGQLLANVATLAFRDVPEDVMDDLRIRDVVSHDSLPSDRPPDL